MTIGVDVGGTKCLGVLLDRGGEIVREQRVRTPRDGSELLGVIESLVNTLKGEATDAVGVGVPGLVDLDGTLRFAPNLPGVVDLEVRAELERRLGLPVRIDNDANAAAWGEHQRGAARGASDALLVTLGTGIGGGLILDGVLHRGAHGFAGEIGHMVVHPNGPPCPCGKRGCWERYASGSGLGNLGREAAIAGRARRVAALAGGDAEDVRGEHVTRAAAEGDESAMAVLAEYARWLAIGLVNLTNTLDPEVIVLGGGLAESADVLLPAVRTSLSELLGGASHRALVRIVAAGLGEHAGAVGAALLAAA